jgi:hypothetical protein
LSFKWTPNDYVGIPKDIQRNDDLGITKNLSKPRAKHLE